MPVTMPNVYDYDYDYDRLRPTTKTSPISLTKYALPTVTGVSERGLLVSLSTARTGKDMKQASQCAEAHKHEVLRRMPHVPSAITIDLATTSSRSKFSNRKLETTLSSSSLGCTRIYDAATTIPGNTLHSPTSAGTLGFAKLDQSRSRSHRSRSNALIFLLGTSARLLLHHDGVDALRATRKSELPVAAEFECAAYCRLLLAVLSTRRPRSSSNAFGGRMVQYDACAMIDA